jgi:lysophospholipase L1-like esterase
VLHLGASHTASDTITGPLRVRFSQRFGEGGRGFIQPGVPGRGYRQLSASYAMSPEWVVHNGMRRDAVGPFGLGGVRVETGVAGAWLERATCERCALGRSMSEVTVHYLEQVGGGGFTVWVDGEPLREVGTALPGVWDPTDEAAGCVQEEAPGDDVPQMRCGAGRYRGAAVTLGLEPGPHAVRVVAWGDGPVAITGLTTEAPGSGVVYSAVGLNGSQAGHFDAFDEALQRVDLEVVRPDLVVFAWGINEMNNPRYRPRDPQAPAEEWARLAAWHTEVYVSLIDRVRAVVPDASCLILLPTDQNPRTHAARAPGAPRCLAHPTTRQVDAAACARALPRTDATIREAQREAARLRGCAVWDKQRAMGGPGGMERWRVHDPPWAGRDGVHLTMAGYEQLANRLFDDLMAAWSLWQVDPDPSFPLPNDPVPLGE